MRILHVTSELAGFAQADHRPGGLGDVIAGLTPALAARGHEVIVVLPRYRAIAEHQRDATLARRLTPFRVQLGKETVDVTLWEGAFPGHPRCKVWLVDHAPSFDREGLYGATATGDHPDNARRFALLCEAALTIAHALDQWPDVVHAHDWQAGPALYYARNPPRGRTHPRRVFTIHNLAFQGLFPPSVIEHIDFSPADFNVQGYEFWGGVGFMKAALVSADAITTGSKRYANEIQTREQGHGLEGLLHSLRERLTGIGNGIDDVAWSPSRDPHLARTYDVDTLGEKRRNKEALQHELKLPLRADLPLFGFVARLSEHKGVDLLAKAMPRILEHGAQLVVHGEGDPALVDALEKLERAHSDRVRVIVGNDERLAHRIYAGVDFALAPSRYEPNGIGQLLAQSYGTPPIVRATGGLADTVVDFDGKSRSGTGFVFQAYTDAALEAALRRAMIVWRDADAYAGLQRRAMRQDFSWRMPAQAYERVYRG